MPTTRRAHILTPPRPRPLPAPRRYERTTHEGTEMGMYGETKCMEIDMNSFNM